MCLEGEVGRLAVSCQIVHSVDGSCVEIQAVGYHLNLVSTSGEEVIVRQESMARETAITPSGSRSQITVSKETRVSTVCS